MENAGPFRSTASGRYRGSMVAIPAVVVGDRAMVRPNSLRSSADHRGGAPPICSTVSRTGVVSVVPLIVIATGYQ